MREKIKTVHTAKSNLVTSGSLRTLYEAENLYPVVRELYGQKNIEVISLQLEVEQSTYRNSHRRLCELTRHPVLFTKETEHLTICPLDGSKLLKRKGLDDPETIKVRLKEYAERTAPVFEYFKGEGQEIKKVNGDQSVADVFGDIAEAIK